MPTQFSIRALMIACVSAAILLALSKLGSGPRIAAAAVSGTLVFLAIPFFVSGSPKSAFLVAGAIGGVVGCGIGILTNASIDSKPTPLMTNIEYQRFFWLHLGILFATVLISMIGGMIVGLCVHNLVNQAKEL